MTKYHAMARVVRAGEPVCIPAFWPSKLPKGLPSRPAQHGESASDPTKLLKGCSKWLADKAS